MGKKISQKEINKIILDAVKEVKRLTKLGWKRKDFAKAFKDFLDGKKTS